MRKTLVLLGMIVTPFTQAQIVLEALDAPNLFSSTKTASYSGNFTRVCPAGQVGTQVTYTTPTYTETRTSYNSQTEADNLAQEAANTKAQADLDANGQTYANTNGYCKNSGGGFVGTCEIFESGMLIQTIHNVDPGYCVMVYQGYELSNHGKSFTWRWH